MDLRVLAGLALAIYGREMLNVTPLIIENNQ
jgi:hypothetical protein